MGQADAHSGDYDIVQAARLRRKQRQLGLPTLAIRTVRAIFANQVSPYLLRVAHQRAAPIRLFIGFLVTITWLVVGGSAAIEFGRNSYTNLNAPVPAAGVAPSGFERTIRAISNGVCVFRDGKACDYRNADARIVAGQTAFTILALITLFFGFWRQLFASAAKAFRYIGARHVIVTGDSTEAQTLALSVAAKKNRRKRAVVLIRKTASSADIESLGAEGVAVLVGNPTDKNVLRAGGARAAYKLVALSESDAENIATAASFKKLASSEPGKVAIRLESHELRRDMPTHGQFGGSDAFSLAEISARLLTRSANFLQDVKKQKTAAGVHVAILGSDETAFAVAERTFRMMWAPGMAAPRVTLFATNASDAENAFKARFPLAFRDPDAPADAPTVWAADIAFKQYNWRAHKNAWLPLKETETERGDITSVVVSYQSDDETLRCAAALAGKREATAPTIYARDDENGTTDVVLSAYEDEDVRTFARQTEILSSSALVDRTIDQAAKQVHETYFESSVFRANQEEYWRALTNGRTFSTRFRRLFKGPSKHLPDAPDARQKALEHDFKEKLGERAYAKLRARLTEDLVIKEKFTPTTPAQRLWENLDEQYVESNRAAADHAILKMHSLGYAPSDKRRKLPPIDGAQISDVTAETEHDRWCADKVLAGWRFGPRNDSEMTHPDLLSYAHIQATRTPEAFKETVAKDRDNWVQAPSVAAYTYPKGFIRIDG